MLYHTVAGFLADRAQTESQRAAIVVDYVCRNVSLWRDDELELPLSAFMALQIGHGSANDCAWVCSEIFRQLRLDCVILRAPSDTKANSDKWLLAVGIERQLYLFDLRLGLPIYTGDRKSIATLADVVNHPEWLALMASSGSYRLSVEDLRQPTVEVISDPLFWCQRMQSIEQVLPAADACVVFDPLLTEAGQSGLLQRLSATYGWSQDQLKQWQFPRRERQGAKHLTAEMQQELLQFTLPFSVPIPFKVDKDGQPSVGTPENKLLRFRVDQLLGKFTETSQKYLSIRHLEVERFPPEIERLNKVAAENAIYWTGVCKFEAGDYESAVSQLTDLIRKYDRKGNWYFPARILLFQCYVELERFADAMTVLERTSSDDPYQEANALRLKWLKEDHPKP